MSDRAGGGPGIRAFGQALGRLGQSFFGLAEQRAREEAAGQAIDRQELLQAQQLFRTRYNEWIAENSDTRFDQIETNYERFAEDFRNTVDGTEQLFTSEPTKEAFSFWFEEAVSERRLPVREQATSNRIAYHTSMYQSNLENAIRGRDVDAVQTAIRAAVEDGVESAGNAMSVLEDSLYQINYANVEDAIMAQAEAMGFEAAEAQLDSLTPEQLQFQVDEDEEGNPIYREFSRDDIDEIKDRVRQRLDEQRDREQYQIDRRDETYAEFANDVFTNGTLGDLYAFKSYLEGFDPQTGKQLGESEDPASGNARWGMKEGTWRTWYNMVNGAIQAKLRDLTDEEAAQEVEDRRAWNLEYLRLVTGDADQKQVEEFVLQGVERGLVDADADGTGEARTLLNFAEAKNENPVFKGIAEEMQLRVNELGLSEADARAVLTDAQDEFLKWFNNEKIRRDETGQWAYNMDSADRATQRKIANNIVLSAAPEEVRAEARAAWAIREGEILPSNQAASSQRSDPRQVSAEEELLAAIQREEYIGWEALVGETGDRVKEQLTTLWNGQAQLFKDLTGFLPMNAEQLDDKGRPIFVQKDRQTGQNTYFRFRIPTDEEGVPAGMWARGPLGLPVPTGPQTADEILQAWVPSRGLWYDVQARPSATPGALGNVQITIRTDLEGWKP